MFLRPRYADLREKKNRRWAVGAEVHIFNSSWHSYVPPSMRRMQTVEAACEYRLCGFVAN